MLPVYSAAFILLTQQAPNNEYIVPASSTAVVRYMSCTQEIGSYAFSCEVANSSIAPRVVIAQNTDLGAFEMFQWEGRVVVPPNGVIIVNLSQVGQSTHIYVGGYLLAN